MKTPAWHLPHGMALPPMQLTTPAVFALLMFASAIAATAWLQATSPARAAMLLIVAPWLEEAAFRAGLQERLMRTGLRPGVGIGLTALAFAAAHMLVRQQWSAIALVLPAIALGVIYQRKRSVTACAATHAAMNSLWLALASLGLQL